MLTQGATERSLQTSRVTSEHSGIWDHFYPQQDGSSFVVFSMRHLLGGQSQQA